ncbi:UDP-3-O-[3-hydroxymyristoyl] N-acetylglucosamine deacetylase [Xanthomonas translucens pv. arrhenatheri]|jgi:UDP-3-O-[3-hydroxymyristoyl] N-acetylglucosamine deacetylase|uniref:UDP-3-O-acyl-N-acetylglucosamine deacetylase n=3 Tax=Xanthomonas graminis TaxID=3390026 RepID=A0A0K2ZUR2_9XANT|nr:UDP-3-O-acyl-N-acetylglucosamine deacetylase [Xanthomonas translucens]EKU26431.1 UDP-3-O-[3-hydroxymyristoyl] N-acetylglucosamine deacetylase [Xanthomonas translucens pv. graminis ART-Xtg29]OAX62649.1 UDP-3-O-[3-hydroxymyristoyl] N-acetylglucosamine deacetylase [Xanthomonas translucens pv. graminis]OAX65593.1 UDP-3-O-[3-hydroxymyristoyl] N-acetylglucosamine deacetylase [Xanthomonas translucens pv. arrhenatheri]UKE53872.1 UDP-3-O-acyl-N-acetylglucosamine deacetylase [Xanthomonas translucens p
MTQQRTLKNTIRATGVGLHSGDKVYMTLRPAPADHGIVFRRVDLEPAVEVPADAELVTETTLCTGLSRGDAKIQTVEHLMSAMAGLGVDNAIVELSSAELPIMDGSSGPFVFLLQSAGIVEQGKPKRFIRIKRPVEVRDGDKIARFAPYDGYKLGFTIQFDHPMIPAKQSRQEIEFSTMAYIKEISRARTFGFMRDLEYMRERNLGLGGSMDNAIVLDEFRVLNDDGLRYADEFVRHKILDAIGDLYLAGGAILGAYEGYKSGHALNNKLVRALLAEQAAWEWVSFDSKAVPAPVAYGAVAYA